MLPTVVPPTGPVAISSALDTDWSRPVALDIDNQAGSVTVVVDPSLKRAEVTAVTTNAGGYPIAAPWAAADVEAAEPHPILRVLAKRTDAATGQTDLTVRVPACAGLRVRNSEGPVVVSGAAGAIDIQSGSDVQRGGDVTLSTGSAVNAPMLVRSAGGSVRLDLPTGSRGLISARSGVDQVTLIAPREQVEAAESVATEWRCDLNRGEFDVRLIADRGPIQIRVGL